MSNPVTVTVEVEPGAAEALADRHTRAAIGRMISQVLAPRSDPGELAQVIAEARAAVEASAAAINRDMSGSALAAAFRRFRRGRRLGNLEPKALIREGLG